MNKDWTIVPYESVGPIRLGSSKEEVRVAVGVPFDVGFDGGNPQYPIDLFLEAELIVYYSRDGICRAVTMWPPFQPMFEGHHLLQEKYVDLKTYLLARDPSVQIGEEGIVSRLLGVFLVSLFGPDVSDEEREVQNIFAFARGYYDAQH